MLFLRYLRVLPYQRVVLFRDDQPLKLYRPGRRLIACVGRSVRLELFDVREPYLKAPDLELIVKSGLLETELTWFRLQDHERGLVWIDGRLDRAVGGGLHALWSSFYRVHHESFSTHDVFLSHRDLDVIVTGGVAKEDSQTLDIPDGQRVLAWVDGCFHRVLGPGRHLLWRSSKALRLETVEVGDGYFLHADLETILSVGAPGALEKVTVDAEHQGLAYRDGRFDRTLAPGLHAFWRGVADFDVRSVDLRERMLDINGQEVMTADKVTLRLNAVVTFRVADALTAVQASRDHEQALYREAQLALRAVVGSRELDLLLTEKERVTAELDGDVRRKAGALGLEVLSLGLRDVVLPGEMRTLMNRVTEAHKAAEANLIARREETQAMRSQANTARIFESNPTLMKLRELEVLEKVAERADLKVVLGEGGLADRLMHMV
ncbi:MAG: slipin family protein [Acidobacteriota bacterium]